MDIRHPLSQPMPQQAQTISLLALAPNKIPSIFAVATPANLLAITNYVMLRNGYVKSIPNQSTICCLHFLKNVRKNYNLNSRLLLIGYSDGSLELVYLAKNQFKLIKRICIFTSPIETIYEDEKANKLVFADSSGYIFIFQLSERLRLEPKFLLSLRQKGRNFFYDHLNTISINQESICFSRIPHLQFLNQRGSYLHKHESQIFYIVREKANNYDELAVKNQLKLSSSSNPSGYTNAAILYGFLVNQDLFLQLKDPLCPFNYFVSIDQKKTIKNVVKMNEEITFGSSFKDLLLLGYDDGTISLRNANSFQVLAEINQKHTINLKTNVQYIDTTQHLQCIFVLFGNLSLRKFKILRQNAQKYSIAEDDFIDKLQESIIFEDEIQTKHLQQGQADYTHQIRTLNSQKLYYEGIRNLQLKKYEQAKQKFTKAIQQNSANIDANLALLFIYEIQNATDEYIQLFNKINQSKIISQEDLEIRIRKEVKHLINIHQALGKVEIDFSAFSGMKFRIQELRRLNLQKDRAVSQERKKYEELLIQYKRVEDELAKVKDSNEKLVQRNVQLKQSLQKGQDLIKRLSEIDQKAKQGVNKILQEKFPRTE